MARGRTRTRTWDQDTELARLVDVVGGRKWAAAIMDVSDEWLVQCLMVGCLRNPDQAQPLIDAVRRAGKPVDVAALMGLSVISGGKGPRGQRRGVVGDKKHCLVDASRAIISASPAVATVPRSRAQIVGSVAVGH